MSSPAIRDTGISKNRGVCRDRSNDTMKAIRNAVLALTLTLTGATSMTNPSVAQAQAISPTTTGVMVILTVKEGVTREQVMAVMPAEIRQTVQLYLNGRFANGIRVATGAEPCSCWIPGMLPRRTHSWRACRWPSKISWTTSTSQSVRFCRSAC